MAARHAVVSPSHQQTIGLGEYGCVVIPDFVSSAFLFDEDESTNAIYTIGLGDVGTIEVPATFHKLDDTESIAKDSFTIGLGDFGTVSFPSFMGDYFLKTSIFTIGLGDLGTLVVDDSSGANAIVDLLKDHKTIGLSDLGTVYIGHEAARSPVYLSMELDGVGTTTVKGYLDRSMKNPPEDLKNSYSVGLGETGTLYFPKSVGGLLDLAKQGKELQGHTTIGLGELGSVQVGIEVARAPVRYTIGLGDLGTIKLNGYLDRSMKNPPKGGQKMYSVGLGDRGTMYFPSFLGKAFDIAKYGHGVLTIGLGEYGTLKLSQGNGDQHFIMDDECYLGKLGDASECVDFDPMHNLRP